MEKQGENNIKLGVFVIIGFVALMVAFYMIGKNRSLFGSNFELKARFANLNGLIEGDNVSFAGIQAGTVKNITFINDSTIQVEMLIDNKIKPYIHSNALASIGTEGVIGEKVVNIIPVKGASPQIQNGDLLSSRQIINTDEMLLTLNKTNNNIATISEALKETVLKINNSSVWDVLNDKTIGDGLRSTLKNINKASGNANQMTVSLNDLATQIKKGKGAAGVLLADTVFASNLKAAMAKIKLTSDNANNLTKQLTQMVNNVNGDLKDQKGVYNLFLRDSLMVKKINTSMDNIQKGTDGFNQNMEALKHNFLFRGYFRKLEKQQKAEKEAAAKAQSKAN